MLPSKTPPKAPEDTHSVPIIRVFISKTLIVKLRIKGLCISIFRSGGLVHSLFFSMQVPRRSGCVTWSNWFSVCLHHTQTAGDHVPRVDQAAPHRGRCTAGRAHTMMKNNNNNKKDEEEKKHESAILNSTWMAPRQCFQIKDWAAA